MNDPHVNDRNMIISAISDSGSMFRMAGNPIKISEYDDPTNRKGPPLLDADRESVLALIAHESAGDTSSS